MTRRDFVAGSAAAAAALAARRLPAQAAADKPIRKAVIDGMLPASVTEGGETRKLSWEDRFALARKLGFDGVEVRPHHEPAAQAEVKAAAEKAGLRIHSIIYGGWHLPLSHRDPAVREKGEQDAAAALRCAKALGADDILLVPAVVNAETRYVEAYERSQKHIRNLIPLAKELDVLILVEEVWNNFLLSPLEFARYIDEFESPHVQAYFDVGNIVKNGWPEDWIRTLGKRIRRLHVKDFKRSTHEWKPLLEGEVNWKEVRKALAEIGYTGWMTAELEGGGEAALAEISKRLDTIIAA